MKTLIVVPARYGSTRFPGKPLAEIAGRSMLARVAIRAKAAADQLQDARMVVATDDDRIIEHCREQGFDAVMTDPAVPSGSDRALAAAAALDEEPAFIVNLQGDAPFTPLHYITKIVEALENSDHDVATPTILLSWDQLDALRAAKKETPFSGTTCITGEDGRAIWFSKTIIPAIRKEEVLRKESALSPVQRHVGLYGYRTPSLRRFVSLPPSRYEELEGLEQLRVLENDMSIVCVPVDAPALSTSGIDTETDLRRAETLIEEHGDPDQELFERA